MISKEQGDISLCSCSVMHYHYKSDNIINTEYKISTDMQLVPIKFNLV